jgi:prepilin-type N-terminal cleavage/methylation domain-containing protein
MMKQRNSEQPKSLRGGFSLVEIIAAIMILSTGLLAMAASMTYIAAQLRSSAFDTQRNLARQQVIEQLRGTVFANVNTNTTGVTVGHYTVRWNVSSQASNAIRRVQLITLGPAYRSQREGSLKMVPDTVMFEIVNPR